MSAIERFLYRLELNIKRKSAITTEGTFMHIISSKAIDDFVIQHPTAKTSLYSWLKIVSKTNFGDLNELRLTFPSADVVKNANGDNLTVFNIHGNEVRLIAAIHYNRNKLYIRYILTHSEYDKGKWKT